MKLPILLLTGFAAILSPVLAQQSRTDFEEPITLIPEQLEADEPAIPDVQPQRTIKQPGADVKSRIRYRQVKTRALQDFAIQQQLDRAADARTDEGKRQALRDYYEMLYARMRKIDPSLEALIALRERAAMSSLAQTRVAPSLLIEN